MRPLVQPYVETLKPYVPGKPAADALRETLRVTIVRDGVRGIDAQGSEQALAELTESGATVG